MQRTRQVQAIPMRRKKAHSDAMMNQSTMDSQVFNQMAPVIDKSVIDELSEPDEITRLNNLPVDEGHSARDSGQLPKSFEQALSVLAFSPAELCLDIGLLVRLFAICQQLPPQQINLLADRLLELNKIKQGGVIGMADLPHLLPELMQQQQAAPPTNQPTTPEQSEQPEQQQPEQLSAGGPPPSPAMQQAAMPATQATSSYQPSSMQVLALQNLGFHYKPEIKAYQHRNPAAAKRYLRHLQLSGFTVVPQAKANSRTHFNGSHIKLQHGEQLVAVQHNVNGATVKFWTNKLPHKLVIAKSGQHQVSK